MGLLMGGCVDDPERPPISWEGEHLDFGSSTPASACAGTQDYLDAYLGAAKQRLGTDPDLHVAYYWVSQNDLGHWCPSVDSVGCTKPDGTIYAADPFSGHELVHAARSADGFSHRFIEEGAATLWASTPRAGQLENRDQLSAIIEDADSGLESENYLLAAHFVAFLLETEGDPAFIELSAATDLETGLGGLEDAVLDAYGTPLSTLIEGYADFGECAEFDFIESLAECQPDAAQMVCDGASTTDVDLSCEATAAVGPVDGVVWQTVAIDVPGDGSYEVYLEGDPGSSATNLARLRGCGSGCAESHEIQTYEGVPNLLPIELAAGRHVLHVYRSVDEPDTLTLTCKPG